ncbi:protein MIZU-KUSSEI 1 [Senna tora]|uniref:Protein MIZU-KUSSEI 1 n=1 Tax=Senna tora TaxID=362788 RepID=A0A834TTL1_9FABA|nr:protein MIZU-KUSSEI 1 [Senna tora]
MASGSVRIALECETTSSSSSGGAKLLEEPRWRTYCNGRKCGYAHAREYYRGGGECEEWRIVKAALEPITIGAGVLPAAPAKGNGASGSEGELMYMRAKFERVSGSRDSEAFYMINIASEGNIGIGGDEGYMEEV